MNAMSQSRRLEMDDVCARIDEAIAANEAANVDNVRRFLLDGLSDRLRKYRCTLSHLNPGEVALVAGQNWFGPGIADLIRESAHHRARGAIVQERAA